VGKCHYRAGGTFASEEDDQDKECALRRAGHSMIVQVNFTRKSESKKTVTILKKYGKIAN
jgi:hypothetical protein